MGDQCHAPADLHTGKGLAVHCTGELVGFGTVWMGPENLSPPDF